MPQLLPGIILFVYCIFSFCREVHLDCQKRFEEERLADEHVLSEVKLFLKDKEVRQ